MNIFSGYPKIKIFYSPLFQINIWLFQVDRIFAILLVYGFPNIQNQRRILGYHVWTASLFNPEAQKMAK